jgi:hypothetical protein
MLFRFFLQKTPQSCIPKSHPISDHQRHQRPPGLTKIEIRVPGIARGFMVILLTLITSACNSPTPFVQPTEPVEPITEIPAAPTDKRRYGNANPLPYSLTNPTGEQRYRQYLFPWR